MLCTHGEAAGSARSGSARYATQPKETALAPTTLGPLALKLQGFLGRIHICIQTQALQM